MKHTATPTSALTRITRATRAPKLTTALLIACAAVSPFFAANDMRAADDILISTAASTTTYDSGTGTFTGEADGLNHLLTDDIGTQLGSSNVVVKTLTGNITVSDALSLSPSSYTLTFDSGNSIYAASDISFLSNTLTWIAASSNYIAANMTVAAGNINITGGLNTGANTVLQTNDGTLTINAANRDVLSNGTLLSGGILVTNANNITLTDVTVNEKTTGFTGTGVFTLNGTLTRSSNGANPVTISADKGIVIGATASIDGAADNTGGITLTSGRNIDIGGQVSSGAPISITATSGTIMIGGRIVSASLINLSGVNILVSGILETTDLTDGKVTIGAGNLTLAAGAGINTAVVEVAGGATLGGTGTISGASTTTINGGILSPGAPGATTGTLSFAGNLSLTDATVLVDLAPDNVSDFIAVTGKVYFASANTLVLQNVLAGSYTLGHADGGFDLSAVALASLSSMAISHGGVDLSAATTANIRQRAALDLDAIIANNDISLLVTDTNNVALTWTGTQNGNWSESAADANWTNGRTDALAVTTFQNGDKVIFDGAETMTRSPIVVATGGVQVAAMDVTGGSYTFSGGAITTADTGTLDVAVATQKLTVSGSDTQVIFTNDASFTGGVAINAGTVQIGNGGAAGSITGSIAVATGATLTYYRSDNGYVVDTPLSGDGTVHFKGTGAANQSSYRVNPNSTAFTGLVVVESGARLVLLDSSTTTGAGIEVRSGGGLYILDNGTNIYRNPISIAGNGWREGAGQLGALRLDNGSEVSGTVTLTADARIAARGGAGITGRISGVISDGGSGYQLEKSEDGKIILSAVNTYTGGTLISAGTLALKDAGSIADSAGVNVAADGTFDIAAVTASTTIKSLAGSGIVNLGLNNLTVGGDNADTVFSGIIKSSYGTQGDPATYGSLTKTGIGTLTLSNLGAPGNDADYIAMHIDAGAVKVSMGTFISPLFDTGTLAVERANATDSFAFGNNVGAVFTGTVDMLKGKIDLNDTNNYALLQNATLKLSAGGSTTVTQDRTIEGLTLNGGTLKFDVANVLPAALLTVTDLNAANGGTIQMDLNKPFDTRIADANFYDYAGSTGAKQVKLVGAANVTGAGTSLVWQDYQGNALGSQTRAIYDYNGNIGTATFGYAGSVLNTATEKGIYLGYTLTQLEADLGETIVLNSTSATDAAPSINAKLTGAGGFQFTGTKNASVGSTLSDYAGPTHIDTSTVTMLTNNAFGQTSGLYLRNDGKLDMSGNTQTVGAIGTYVGTEITVGNLTITEGGEIAGGLKGDAAALVNLTGGALNMLGNSSTFAGTFQQGTGTTVNLASSLNLGGTFNQTGGTLNSLNGATLSDATFAGTVTPSGTLNLATGTFNGTTVHISLLKDGNKIVATGDVTFSGAVTVNVDAREATANDYTLIAAGGTMTGDDNVTVNANMYEDQRGGKFVESNILKYHVINGNVTDLVWDGTVAAATWNTIRSNTNWTSGPVNIQFRTADSVTFNDLAASKNVVVDAAGVTVADMTVNNSTGNDYTFDGGLITGTGKLTKTDAGNLALNVETGFAKGTAMTGGTITLGHDRALGEWLQNASNILDSAGQLYVADGETVAVTGARNVKNRFFVEINHGLTLDIAAGNSLTISEVNVTGVPDTQGGAGFFLGGDSDNAGISLTTTGSGSLTLSDNSVTGDNLVSGGAIAARFGVNVDLSSLSSLNIERNSVNVAADNGRGGALYSSGNLTLGQNVTISDNSAAGSGGGVYAESNAAFRGNTLFSGNTATGQGGAIYMLGGIDEASRKTLALDTTDGDITFTGNTANGAANSVHMNQFVDLVVNGDNDVHFGDLIDATEGNNNFVKNGTGTVFFSGANVLNRGATGGTVSINAGTMQLNAGATFDAGNSAFDLGAAAVLSVNISGTTPLITAATMDFNTTGTLDITGYAPGSANPFIAPVEESVVIRTTAGVLNFNPAVTVVGQANADFLSASANLSAGGKDVVVATGLSWYSTDPNRTAHGDFTIDSGTFTLGAVLADNSASTNLRTGASAWDGNSLTKLGAGTLILTRENTYTGNTTITAGTLQVGTATFVNPLFGTGTLAVARPDAADSFAFGSGVGTAFTGTLDLLKGSISLDESDNYALLQNASLKLGAGGSTSVTQDRTIKDLTLNGGVLAVTFNNDQLQGVLDVNELAIGTGGTIRLNGVNAGGTGTAAMPITPALIDSDNGLGAHFLIDGIIDTPVTQLVNATAIAAGSSGKQLAIVDENGAPISAAASYKITYQENGYDVVTASYGYTGAVGTQAATGAQGIFLSYGLIEAEVLDGRTLVFDVADLAVNSDRILSAKLSGSGSAEFKSDATGITIATPATLTGAVALSAGKLIATTNDVFQDADVVTLAGGTAFNADGTTQSFKTLALDTGSVYTAGTTTINTALNATGADLQIAGDLVNNGTATVANSNLGITGNFVNTGTANISFGDSVSARPIAGGIVNSGTINYDAPQGRIVEIGGALVNNGLFNFVHAGRTLSVAALSGNGTIALDVDPSGLTPSDKIIVRGGGSVSGTQHLALRFTGDVNTLSQNDKLVLVDTSALDPANIAADAVTGSMTAGLYEYNVTLVNGSFAFDPSTTSYSGGSQAIVNTIGAMAIGWFSQLDNLTKRMGELRLSESDAGAATGTTGSFWTRAYGQQVNASLGITGMSDFKEYQYGADVGADNAFVIDESSRAYLGMFAGYQGATRRFHDGNGSKGNTDSVYGGVYGTWIHADGWYADGVIKAQYFSNDYEADGDKGDFDNYGLGASIELGKQFRSERGWFAEPSVQFAYTHIFADSYTTDQSMRVLAGDSDIYRFAGGIRFGKNVDLGTGGTIQPYAKIGVEQQISDGGSVRIASEKFEPNTDGTRMTYGAGIIWQLDAAQQIHLDYEGAFGDKYDKPWGVNAGYRVTF